MQQPAPPPAPPPQPPHDFKADRLRTIAELDGLAQKREKQMRDEFMAQRNFDDLNRQNSATPAQAIVNHFHQYQPVREVHHLQTPIHIPTPQVPQNESASEHMRAMGQTFHQHFLAQNTSVLNLNLPHRGETIPIQYSDDDPPSFPVAGKMLKDKSYGPAKVAPAKLTKERYIPFEGAPLPAPSPTDQTISIPAKPKKEKPSQPNPEKNHS